VDKELAKTIAATVFRCGSSLQDLIPELTARCSSDEKTMYVKAIASAIAGMHVELLDRVFATHPELEREIEQNIEATGLAFPEPGRKSIG